MHLSLCKLSINLLPSSILDFLEISQLAKRYESGMSILQVTRLFIFQVILCKYVQSMFDWVIAFSWKCCISYNEMQLKCLLLEWAD